MPKMGPYDTQSQASDMHMMKCQTTSVSFDIPQKCRISPTNRVSTHCHLAVQINTRF